MRVAAAAMCIAFVAAQAGIAGAQPGQTPPSQTPPAVPAPYSYQPQYGPPLTHTEKYGATIALVDGLSFGAIFVGALVLVVGLNEDTASNGGGGTALGAVLIIGGGVGLIAGGPLVHLHKHNGSSAWKSLALRVGLPILGSAIGAAIDGDCSDPSQTCDQRGSSLGGIGFVAAAAIDWFVLAKHQVETPTYVMPYAAPAAGGATFGLGGRF